MSDLPVKAKRTPPAAMDVADNEERAAITKGSTWFLFLRQVPVWERQRISEEIMAIDVNSHEGFRQLQQLLLAEVAAGTLPSSFIREIDALLKNIFASVVVQSQPKDAGAANPLHTLIEKFSVERRTISQVAPAYGGNVIDAAPVLEKKLG